MELRHLRYMLALAEHRSFTRAARAVHVTQSTLSHQIRQLELEVGFDLFDRSIRGVALTAAGETLLPAVSRALEELNSALLSVKRSLGSEPKEVRFLVGARGAARRLVAVALCDQWTGGEEVNGKIEEVYATALQQRLESDSGADVVVGDFQNLPADWRFEPLYTEEIGLLVPPEHRLAARRRVRIIDLHDEALVLTSKPEPTRLIIDECLRRAHVTPRVVAELNLPEATFEMAASSGFAAVAPRNLLGAHGLIYLPLVDPAPRRVIGLMWAPDRPVSLVTRAMVARLHKAVEAFCSRKDPSFIIEACDTPTVASARPVESKPAEPADMLAS